MRSIKLVVAAAAVSLVAATAAWADGWGPATPDFNLEAILRPAGTATDGFGHVKFRQPKDDAKIIYLDAWVRDLDPSHSYVLERAVDTMVDGACPAGGWAPLGSIPIDADGTGRAALTRNVSAIPTGTEFDIHFRVFDQTAQTVALQSDCYQYVVSQ